MSAIITDQLRILNAKNFVSAATSTTSNYYTFVGLTNATDYDPNWDSLPPAPKDNFDQENDYWDTIIALKKITSGDIRQVVRKNTWTTGIIYDMYSNNISRTNLSVPSNSTSLYSSNFYVVNSDFRVYICLYNGISPENPSGRPSLDEPRFTDLEPRAAGDSEDGYIWKYLYTIKPSELIKFDSTNFIPVPTDWETNSDYAPIRDNAISGGQIKIIRVLDRGTGIGTANRTYTNVPIYGDGAGAECTIVVNSDSVVESAIVTNGGSGYTYGTVDLVRGGVPTGSSSPSFKVIIPPQNGHGYDIYRELGAYRVLIYSRIENDIENPDFITGNKVARVGIVENPLSFNSDEVLTLNKASALPAIKLIGAGYSTANFVPNSFFTQTVGFGSTAVGRVVSYDKNTGVLKYFQDRTLVGFNSNGTSNPSPIYGFNLNSFTANPDDGGSIIIESPNVSGLGIDTSFTGVTTTINNRKYFLGQTFVEGVANPEVEKHSGNIIYIDNRPSITRSSNQKEDIKVILQF
jgi:hypothetical protein